MVEAVSLTKTKKLVIDAAADQDIAAIDAKVTYQFVLKKTTDRERQIASNKTRVKYACNKWPYIHRDIIVFSHDVKVALLVFQNNETAAMLVFQTNPVGVELFSYVNAFFCSNKFA